MKIYFSDFFNVDSDVIDGYGAFNPSLLNDLPLFIDPFLLYSNDNEEIKDLHHSVISYVGFLKEKASDGNIDIQKLKSWFFFPEVKQNWFGYSEIENGGSGLGRTFADSLNKNLHTIFSNFGSENISTDSHLEKLCLVNEGVGKDAISDFTTNLIKEYLLEYTQKFAVDNIDKSLLQVFTVKKVSFDYDNEVWINKKYTLPCHKGDFVLLTPKSILTKDDTWINKKDLCANYDGVINSISNDELRDRFVNEVLRLTPEDDHTIKSRNKAIAETILKYPQYIDYFIKHKESRGNEAKINSSIKVNQTEKLFIENISEIFKELNKTEFYDITSFDGKEINLKVSLFKNLIESKGGSGFLYINENFITREKELGIFIKMLFMAKGDYDFNKIKGKVKFKLASNNKLKDALVSKCKNEVNLKDEQKQIMPIICYKDSDFVRVQKLITESKLKEDDFLFTIDARPSA